MNLEKRPNGVEVPSRLELNDSINQYPKSALLPQVEALSREAYSVLYNEYNKGTFTFNDFALYEEEHDLETISRLLNLLEESESEEEKRVVAEQIAKTLVS